ncbi:complex I intermediate-associated protein-like protein CIA30 [Lophiostoma macrostomum CBS 122681]|uniref:Complex I intermediate-associated protein-like protein CIA30 n=1 Tax=Lophiostoma macrostomum CBS 122681 TaxID=1314788 RepID=A0A6A6T477_9PLEO|nr:complex I intermediate-associated protein-like protein CIA30 [Lophiostoma macrostomum CBS 122681]
MMHPSPRCLADGFVRRSLLEFKRLSLVALKAEALRAPTKAHPLVLFDSPDDLNACKRMSDKDIGGFSTANLDFHARTARWPSHARFHGDISIKLPVDNPHVQRTGYAAWRTKDPAFTIFGRQLWDLDRYEYLAIQFKSDGRKYFVNVQTESIVPTDIHQHRLHSKHPGQWETTFIKWNEFVRTNHGQVVEPQKEMRTSRVRTVGIGLIDRIPGPYDLSVSRIWATNATVDDEILQGIKGAVSGLPVGPSEPREDVRKSEKPLKRNAVDDALD